MPVCWRPGKARRQREPGCAPNDLRISCRPSSPRPHQLTFHSAPKEGAARTEGRRPSGLSAACAG
jgi:hypothetical protein